jgi:GTP-binding protein
MKMMSTPANGRVRIDFLIPTRGLFGFRNEFLTNTRGSGIMSHVFDSYLPWRGDVAPRGRGALVVLEAGETTAYSLEALEPRGTLFVGPGVPTYTGQVIGESARKTT